MRLRGLQRVTLLDFPGKVACTVFTVGCNFRCPFCHNASLVTQEAESIASSDDAPRNTSIAAPSSSSDTTGDLSTEDFFAFLASRKGKLDGVCVSGGEPLLQPDIRAFIVRIREMGFAVKLDTNGSFPDVLEGLLAEGLLDYVAMDIKSSPEHYAAAVGLAEAPLDRIGRSVQLLLTSGVPFEFRTTVVEELHSAEDFRRIGEWIDGAPRYYLQEFTDSGDTLCRGCHPMSRERIEEAARFVSPHIAAVGIR